MPQIRDVSWKDIAELVGIAAIVASLIFVGLELRQSQQIAQATQYQERTRLAFDYYVDASGRDIWTKWVADRQRNEYENLPKDALSDIEKKLVEGDSSKDISDWYVNTEVNIMLFDNFYYQYQQGLSTDELWQAQRERFKSLLTGNTIARQRMTVHGHRYRASLVALAQELLAEMESEAN